MFQEINAIVVGILTQDWTYTQIAWDNIDFTPTRGTPFIRPRIYVPVVKNIAVGTRMRGTGYIQISIFVPCNSDTELVNRYADQLLEIFVVANKYPSVIFEPPSINRRPEKDEWYSVALTVPFTYDECYN